MQKGKLLSNQWTMNCILFGAKIQGMIKDNIPDKTVLEEIKNLTSEFNDIDANYLLMRLKELVKK
jgi:hypothetical protein